MKKQAYNPFLPPNVYIPDGEPHVFGNRVYLYGSHDQEGGQHYCMLDYECWSAPVDDLSDWRCEGTIYRAEQCPHYSEERQDLYAPDVVQGPDGRYYLYYDLSGRSGNHGFDGPISVAVCDTPAGKYTYYGDVHYPDGRPMRRFIPFDPAVLNDSGRIWLTYGWGLGMDTHAPIMRNVMPHVMSKIFNKPLAEIREEEPKSILGANIVELEPDMQTVKSEPKRILPALNNAPKGSPLRDHSFYEAASLRKIGQLYYFIYSPHNGHELCYATSPYPDRGYTYRGVIVSNGDIGLDGRNAKDKVNAVATNHGSIEKINGQYYIFYHRQTHGTDFSRQACAEPIRIEADGMISQVPVTSCGLNGGPLRGEGIYPAYICCNLTNGKMPKLSNTRKNPSIPNVSHEGSKHFIRAITDKTMVGYKYFSFCGETSLCLTYRGDGGQVFVSVGDCEVGKISLPSAKTWQNSEGITIQASGKQPLYFVYHGTGKIDLLQFELEVCSHADNF